MAAPRRRRARHRRHTSAHASSRPRRRPRRLARRPLARRRADRRVPCREPGDGNAEEVGVLFAEAQAAKALVDEAAARIVDRALPPGRRLLPQPDPTRCARIATSTLAPSCVRSRRQARRRLPRPRRPRRRDPAPLRWRSPPQRPRHRPRHWVRDPSLPRRPQGGILPSRRAPEPPLIRAVSGGAAGLGPHPAMPVRVPGRCCSLGSNSSSKRGGGARPRGGAGAKPLLAGQIA